MSNADLYQSELIKRGFSKDLPESTNVKGMLSFAVMCGHGDVRKIWNCASADEVEDARRSWAYLVDEKGYLAFKVDPDDGSKGAQAREFDPEAGKLIFVPQMRGG